MTQRWHWPLPFRVRVPKPGEPGAFATVRKHHIHEGVDLYCNLGTRVVACEDGMVVRKVDCFTGEAAGSPWWNNTEALMVRGDSGIIVYGEIKADVGLYSYVRRGSPIGRVLRVLKNDKGTPMNMLHLELRESRWDGDFDWKLGTVQPCRLWDPTPHLKRSHRAFNT